MTPLRQRMSEDMQVRNLAPGTQASYIRHLALFARHFNKPPEQLGPEQIRAYQVYLTNGKKMEPGSVAVAVPALRFLYKVSLKKEWALPGPHSSAQNTAEDGRGTDYAAYVGAPDGNLEDLVSHLQTFYGIQLVPAEKLRLQP